MEGAQKGSSRGAAGNWGRRGYIMGNARGIPRDPKSSPVRMRRAD